MEVARTSMIHAAAPHFLWPFVVRYAAHQLNLWPRVSLPETSPTLRWTGKVGDASVFRLSSQELLQVLRLGVLRLGVRSRGVRVLRVLGLGVLSLRVLGLGVLSQRVQSLGVLSRRVRGLGVLSLGVLLRLEVLWAGEPGDTRAGGAAVTTGAGDPTEPGAADAESAGAGIAGVGGPSAGGAKAEGARAVDPGAGGAGGTVRPRPYFVPLLQQVLGVPSSTSLPPPFLCPPPDQSQPPLQPAFPLPVPSPYTEQTGGLTERREPATCPVSPVCTARRAPHLRPPPVPSTHTMALRPSSVPLHVPLPAPPESSLPEVPDRESDRARAASPTVTRLLATAVTDPSFKSAAASALVAELLNFAAACRLVYASALVAESVPASPPSVEGECALGTDILEDRQEDFEYLAAVVPRFASLLLAPEGDPDAPDIPTPRSYAEAITGPYTSQWQVAMDAEMASWKSTGTYVNEVPPPGVNIVDGMWIFRVKRPPGSPPAFKARYVARAAQRDYELHSLDFSTAFLQGSLHEEIWMDRTPGFTGSFRAGTLSSLRRPVYGLRQAPRDCHDTRRITLAALGFVPFTADQSLFLRTETWLSPFYVLVYVDDLVFATADTEALTLVKSELHKRHTCADLGELRSYLGLQITRDRPRRTITLTQSHMVHQVLQRFGFHYSSPELTPLSTSHSLSAPPSDESVEPSGPYPELVGCLMYLMTCTGPDLAYPLSLLALYVALGRHRKVHWDAAKRVLRYLCSTSGMGLVLGGRGPLVLTGHADASWVDDSATQRSSQGYTFSLGSGSVSWRSTRSSSVLSSSCEAEIYAGAMAAQELRWLTYLLTDLGEQPRSPPVLYVDNKAMIALCQEHRLEHRTKHIALRYFLARELQQHGQLRLAYVATRANTADVFTKALPPGLNMTGTDSRCVDGEMGRGREAGEQGGVAGGGVRTHQPANPTLPMSTTPSPTTVDPVKAFSIEKFMGEDYEHWSLRMGLMYTQYKLFDLVEGNEKIPQAMELKGAWMKRSFDAYMLMSWFALVINLNSQQPKWSVDYIRARILKEDLRRRSVEHLEEGVGYGFGGGKSGFKKKWKGKNKDNPMEDGGGGQGEVCFYCKKRIHRWRKCYQRPKDWTPSSSSNQHGRKRSGGVMGASGEEKGSKSEERKAGFFFFVNEGATDPAMAAKFVEDVMYKDRQQQQQVQIGVRLQEMEQSAVEEVQLHLEDLHGSELTSDHSGGGEQQVSGPAVEEGLEDESARVDSPSQPEPAATAKVTKRSVQRGASPHGQQTATRDKRLTAPPSRLNYSRLGGPKQGLNMTGTDSRGVNGEMAIGREAGEKGEVAGGGVGTHQLANPTLPTSTTPFPTTVDPVKTFSIEKFMGEDYEHWSFRMRLMARVAAGRTRAWAAAERTRAQADQSAGSNGRQRAAQARAATGSNRQHRLGRQRAAQARAATGGNGQHRHVQQQAAQARAATSGNRQHRHGQQQAATGSTSMGSNRQQRAAQAQAAMGGNRQHRHGQQQAAQARAATGGNRQHRHGQQRAATGSTGTGSNGRQRAAQARAATGGNGQHRHM
ncbi:unnamed protein product [Closterium sp. NIES-65]|nr:unnamed protein product [Closterium sp. NIES-65]